MRQLTGNHLYHLRANKAGQGAEPANVKTMSQVREGAVTVLGAIVVDFIWRPSHLPQPGETVLAPTYSTHPGGKGANQVSDVHEPRALQNVFQPTHFLSNVLVREVFFRITQFL